MKERDRVREKRLERVKIKKGRRRESPIPLKRFYAGASLLLLLSLRLFVETCTIHIKPHFHTFSNRYWAIWIKNAAKWQRWKRIIAQTQYLPNYQLCFSISKIRPCLFRLHVHKYTCTARTIVIPFAKAHIPIDVRIGWRCLQIIRPSLIVRRTISDNAM